MTTETIAFYNDLKAYGIPEAAIKSLQVPSPALLDYLDLLNRSQNHPDVVVPHCVVESQDRPLLFVVNESLFENALQDEDYHKLQHALACRGQHSYLARLRSGELHVFPVDATKWRKARIYTSNTEEALSFFPNLAFGHYDGQPATITNDIVFEKMRVLLVSAAKALKTDGIAEQDVLSLVGRALFFRFLCDREIISDVHVTDIAPNADTLEDCFNGANNTISTCNWLDRTFNGNFLPLSRSAEVFFEEKEEQGATAIFGHLSAIARAYEAVGTGVYQTRLRFDDWKDFDFAHVPVGLLSQIYEYFANEWDQHARATSVHYTPRNIASTLVDMVFEGLPRADQARVLDPACGAGVFLVLAFRHLYRERWQAMGQRPSTKEIRQILMQQVRGFDISESALKLAALSLYLTAIELDPSPLAPESLRFENLQDRVLFNWRRPEEARKGQIPGSLNPDIGTEFDGQCDIVLSNPPWTAIQDGDLAGELDRVSRQIIERRSDEETAKTYKNPHNSPDLPFLWKSMEWCRRGGRIAMALPARILLQQKEIPESARQTLFRLLEVNGIINGSNISKTKVWPEMEQPFMLLLATNRLPATRHSLHYMTPYFDESLNRQGKLWIDAEATVPVAPSVAFAEPWLWKALAIGTSLDVEVIRKIKALAVPTLSTYWEISHNLLSRRGYSVEGKQQDAKALQVLPDLGDTGAFLFLVDIARLNKFSRSTLEFPRLLLSKDKQFKGDPLAVYRAPLVLVKEAPGTDRRHGRGLLSFEDTAYNKSFYGYSASGHLEKDLLARYLHLFVHSDLWLYYALMTSPKLGAERNTFYKTDLDECPFIPLEQLSVEQKEQMFALSERLLAEEESVFDEIDNFFVELYGLDKLDLRVIQDTLEVGLPYKQMRQRACGPPTAEDKARFLIYLEKLICPFFTITGKQPRLESWHSKIDQRQHVSSISPPAYDILILSTQAHPAPMPDESLWHQIVLLAHESGATRIFLETDGGLVIALANQYRYWTYTRTRLCASEILRRFMHLFK